MKGGSYVSNMFDVTVVVVQNLLMFPLAIVLIKLYYTINTVFNQVVVFNLDNLTICYHTCYSYGNLVRVLQPNDYNRHYEVLVLILNTLRTTSTVFVCVLILHH